MGYPVESLLRPPVELYSSAVSFTFAFFLWYAPEFLLMTPTIAYSSSIILVVLGLIRLRMGIKIIRYKRGLKRLPFYAMSSKQVPVSKRKLFIGKGFRWRQKHVQRLRDICVDDADYYLSQSWFYRFARWAEIQFENTPVLKKAVLVFSLNTMFNPARPLPPVGGAPEIHSVGMWEGENNIYMDIGERVGHTLVLGTTRVGKTRLAELLITQDIHRGDVTVVFDPKGDADLMRRVYGEAKRAGRPVYIFHLGYPDISARYNPVGEFSRTTEVAGRIADQLPSEGNSAAFKMFAWRFVNIIAHALVKLGERPDYPQISRHILSIDKLFVRYAQFVLNSEAIKNWPEQVQVIADNIDEKNLSFALKGRDAEAIALMRFIEANDNIYDPVLDGLLGAFKYDKTYFDKIVSSLAPLLEQLTSGRTAELIAPEYINVDDSRPIFDWKTVIQQKAVVYVGLDCLSDAVVGSAIGASMFADLTSVAGNLYKHGLDHGLTELRDGKGRVQKTKLPKIALHADEFNELVGDQFIPMLNKAGGAGFQVTAYTQTAADILAGIGDSAKAGQIEGNFNTVIMLRVKTTATAEFLTDQLPDVQVNQLTQVSSARDSSDTEDEAHFYSTNEDRKTTETVPMLTTFNVTSLPKGQAFAMIEGGQLYKIRLPLPKSVRGELPDDLEAMASDMKHNYEATLPSGNTPENWFSSNDHSWYRKEVA